MLFTILLIFLLTQWSVSIYLPIVPKIALLFAPQQALIVSSLSWLFIGYAFGQLFWGALSDHIGRYRALLISLILYSLFEFVIAITTTATTFLSILICIGFITAAQTAVGNALIKETYGKHTKTVIGYVGITLACAPVIAPVLGSHLYVLWGWPSCFIFLGMLGVLTLLLFAFLFSPRRQPHLHTHKAHPQKTSVYIMFKTTVSDKTFMSYVTLLSISFGILFTILLALPFVLTKQVQLPITTVGYLMFMTSFSYIGGALFNTFLTKRKEIHFINYLGLSAMLLGGCILIASDFMLHNLLSILSLFALAICMFGLGVIIPASKTGAMLLPHKYTGSAAAIMKFTQTLGGVILTKIASYCILYGKVQLLLAILVMSIFFLGLIWLLLPVTKSKKQ